MSDATRLLITLEEYSAALERHFSALREKHDHLVAHWGGCRDRYEGAGAEVFAQAMEHASARFREMIETGGFIQNTLKAKIEELRKFDAPSG